MAKSNVIIDLFKSIWYQACIFAISMSVVFSVTVNQILSFVAMDFVYNNRHHILFRFPLYFQMNFWVTLKDWECWFDFCGIPLLWIYLSCIWTLFFCIFLKYILFFCNLFICWLFIYGHVYCSFLFYQFSLKSLPRHLPRQWKLVWIDCLSYKWLFSESTQSCFCFSVTARCQHELVGPNQLLPHSQLLSWLRPHFCNLV